MEVRKRSAFWFIPRVKDTVGKVYSSQWSDYLKSASEGLYEFLLTAGVSICVSAG